MLVAVYFLVLLALGADRPGENGQEVDWEVSVFP